MLSPYIRSLLFRFQRSNWNKWPSSGHFGRDSPFCVLCSMLCLYAKHPRTVDNNNRPNTIVKGNYNGFFMNDKIEKEKHEKTELDRTGFPTQHRKRQARVSFRVRVEKPWVVIKEWKNNNNGIFFNPKKIPVMCCRSLVFCSQWILMLTTPSLTLILLNTPIQNRFFIIHHWP